MYIDGLFRCYKLESNTPNGFSFFISNNNVFICGIRFGNLYKLLDFDKVRYGIFKIPAFVLSDAIFICMKLSRDVTYNFIGHSYGGTIALICSEIRKKIERVITFNAPNIEMAMLARRRNIIVLSNMYDITAITSGVDMCDIAEYSFKFPANVIKSHSLYSYDKSKINSMVHRLLKN